MKDALRTRLEFLWAKLAGRDVDIDTLTPDAPTSMVEKLMLETADRITDAEQSGGGGSDKYIVHFSLSGSTYVTDSTFEQIESAVNANKTVVGIVDGMGFVDLLACGRTNGAIFQALAPIDSDFATLYIFDVMPNDQIYVATHDIPYSQGGGGTPEPAPPLVIYWENEGGVYTFDMTYSDIVSAMYEGRQVFVYTDSVDRTGGIYISGCYVDNLYHVVLPCFPPAAQQYTVEFTTDSLDGYPSYSDAPA